MAEQRFDASSGETLALGGSYLHTDFVIDQPVRWYLVLDGEAGPGAVEQPKAVLANTDEAAWEWVCFY